MANFYGREEYDSSVGTTTNAAGSYLGRTTVVGSYEANGWGLYDMHGNVWEWCSDVWYIRGLPGGRVIDPQSPATGSIRVFRGGCWGDIPRNCRSANRGDGDDFRDYREYRFGFRVVLAPGQ